jgi:hypothetical protein
METLLSEFSKYNLKPPAPNLAVREFFDCVKDKFDVTSDIGISVAERPGKLS